MIYIAQIYYDINLLSIYFDHLDLVCNGLHYAVFYNGIVILIFFHLKRHVVHLKRYKQYMVG